MSLIKASLLWLIAFSGQALCQDTGHNARQRSPDAQIYESFFSQIADSTTGDTLYPPSPGPPIVLTKYENEALRLVAAECKSKIRSLKAAMSSLRLELLFQSIESGQAPAKLRQKLDDLEEQQPRMVSEYFQSLKFIFGAERFQMVQEFIREWDPDKGSPFAMPPPKPYPVAKAK